MGTAVRLSGESTGPSLPVSLKMAVRQEFARALQAPYETFITVAVNGALMSSAWFLLPQGLKDEVFTLHGTLAFALVLATWMYSDVPATNVLGPDAARTIAAIDEPVMLRRLLYSKSIMLWTLITPVCLVVALVNGALSHDLLATLYSIIWIGVVPFGVLGLSGIVGIRFPYHPMPIRYRWGHRLPRRRMLWRWLALVVTPSGLVPLLGGLIMLPEIPSYCGASRQPTACPRSFQTTTSDGVWRWPVAWPSSVRWAATVTEPGWHIDGVTRS
jgi:hypothetical protein